MWRDTNFMANLFIKPISMIRYYCWKVYWSLLLLSSPNRPTSQTDLPYYRVKIFGDSITRYWPCNIQSEWFIPDVTTKPGCTVPRMIKTLRNFEPQTKTPHTVIFHVGTNDLNCSVFHRDVKNFNLLIQVAKEKYPQSKIFMNAILPRHDDDSLNST